MSAAPPLRERREGAVLRLTLADPARANALSPALVEALTAAYARDLRREGIRAVVLDAEGRQFSAGADLAHLRRLQEATAEENRQDSLAMMRLFRAILEQEALTVALVQGACVAGGCGVATAHDFVIAADGARFLYSEVRIGFVAALVATFLPLRVRGADLRELLLDADFVPAERALAVGLVNRVVPAAELEARGLAFVDELLAKASGESIARTKRLLLATLGRPLDEALAAAAEVNAAARATADCRRGIATFLAEKKTPDWRS